MLLLALGAGGCDLVLPLGGLPAVREGGGDALGRDAPRNRDGASANDLVPAADLPDDSGADEQNGEDQGPSDLPASSDQAMAADLNGPDAPADLAQAADQAPALDSAAAVTGCSTATATQVAAVDAKLVICASKDTTTYDQCAADALCAAGWSLCPAALYRQRFDGTGAAPPAVTAWIAGCVRDNGKLTSPTNGVCSCNYAIASTNSDVAWNCTNGDATTVSAARYLGLATAGSCSQVGESLASNAGFWLPQAAFSTKNHAVCCLP